MQTVTATLCLKNQPSMGQGIMHLSIIQRTIAGFILMFILLAILGGISYLNTKQINLSLKTVTEETTPLLISNADLKGALLKNNRSLLEYRTTYETADLSIHQEQFNKEKNQFEQISQQLSSSKALDPSIQSSFNEVQTAASNYFGLAEQILSEHRNLLETLNALSALRDDFVKQEDNFQQATLLLLGETASKRSQRNKAERVTSGIARDLKEIRRAGIKTDLTALQKALSADIEKALSGAKKIKVDEGVIIRFNSAVNKLRDISISEQGLLPLMLKQQKLETNIVRLTEQANQQMAQVEQLLTSFTAQAQTESEAAKSSADKAVKTAVFYIVIVTLISAAVAAIIGFTIARSIHKPLSLITPVLKVMAEGNMTQRVDYQSSDEFGTLSESLNTLVDSMADVLSKINQGSVQLVQEANNAAEISDRTMARVADQKNQTDQVATAISEMEVSVGEVFRSTENTLSEVTLANEDTDTGRELVAKNRQLTEQLANSINEAVSITQKLEEFSANIGSILDVIRGIAEQTNLLALNAAIEAARAGEQGRGFAVVADEVRTLATRTQQSTIEIQAMIENLQKSSRQVANVMHQSQEQTNHCVDQTRLTDEALQAVATRMEAIKEMSVHVAQATEEQIAVSQDIAKNINGITEVALETEREASDSARISEVLAQLIEQQQTLIRRFKV
ncbi:methyl-accepting chemotaxis protein [Motilimonas sp. 1_MG-2023]|uniref:HAMP domain-containing methyl-accepting chemotaxis protein n=1 Tax=Motilimonas sp. 1_MG-2023 TaxID=3062672 RepID=UPI0026E17291|nr:methyl-accepting chemotaxis protein [Motilimonas sp. 1_MG-2023]